MSKYQENITAVFDYATMHPQGFTKAELCAATGMTRPEANKAIQGVRTTFADERVTLTCQPNGRGEDWTYRLVSTVAEGGGYWVDNRMRDARARFSTLASVTGSLVHATDGRTKDGRLAREMHLTSKQLLERLDMIEETL